MSLVLFSPLILSHHLGCVGLRLSQNLEWAQPSLFLTCFSVLTRMPFVTSGMLWLIHVRIKSRACLVPPHWPGLGGACMCVHVHVCEHAHACRTCMTCVCVCTGDHDHTHIYTVSPNISMDTHYNCVCSCAHVSVLHVCMYVYVCVYTERREPAPSGSLSKPARPSSHDCCPLDGTLG